VKHDADRVLAHTYADEVYVKPTYDFYRPTLAQQLQQVAGCLAHMAALILAAFVIWALLITLFLGAA
jgi:hypothetical protein